jgi:hypothetical protein
MLTSVARRDIREAKGMGTMNKIPRSQRFSLTAQTRENAFVGMAAEPENYLAESDWERDPSLSYCSTRMAAAEI